MYVLYKSKNILTLVTIGYIVGFIVGMYIEYCLWAQVAALDIYCIYWTVWDRNMQVLYLGRALRTKETLPDFLKWRRVTRHPLVFRGLTGSQRTPGFWGFTKMAQPPVAPRRQQPHTHKGDDNQTRTKAKTKSRKKTYKNLDYCRKTTLLRKKRCKRGVEG